VRNLDKTFSFCKALDDVSLTIAPGEMVALIGASGSGKSTLMRHLSGFVAGDRGTGTVAMLGRRVQESGRVAADIRDIRSHIGFVFQQFNLVPRLPVLTNVLVGFLHQIVWWRGLLKRFSLEQRQQALEALVAVGIEQFAWQRASTLSGGQQQRAALARCLVQKARVVLADEPIASLDPESARKVMELLLQMNRQHGCTVLVSLHQVEFALRYCPRTIAMRAGRVIYDGPSTALDPAFLRQLYGSGADELYESLDHSSVRSPAFDAAAPVAIA
jgi:phosphonate transport system ATP-binding protein